MLKFGKKMDILESFWVFYTSVKMELPVFSPDTMLFQALLFFFPF